MTDDLEARVDALEQSLRELREALTTTDHHSPDPPGRFLAITRDFALPLGVAAVEAQVKTLELFADQLRELDHTRSRQLTLTELTQDQAPTTLARLDRLLDRIEADLEETSDATTNRAHELLDETRALQQEVAAALNTRSRATDSHFEEADGVQIDVESELETIRDELDRDTTPDESDGDAS